MNNNCNDNYDRIKKKIEEERERCKYCYIQGPRGAKGERGERGPATIKVGKVETIEPILPAEVINTGTAEDVILDFKIPKGVQGIEGKTGPQGIQGIKGERGEVGPQGMKGERGERGPTTIKVGKVETIEPTLPAEVINTGTAEDVILDFKIPKGDKGEEGEMGPRGLPGEIGRTEHIAIDETETLEPGEEAQVMDTFEDWVHHLTFQIPKGEQGIQGPRGIQGPAGPPGTNFVKAELPAGVHQHEQRDLTGGLGASLRSGHRAEHL